MIVFVFEDDFWCLYLNVFISDSVSETGFCRLWTDWYSFNCCTFVYIYECKLWQRCNNRMNALRKYAYSNIMKNLPPKIENFQIKNYDNFHISAQNIDCGYSLEPPRRGGSNEYPQSMFLSRNKKNIVYPCKPQFCYIKVGFKGVKII